MPARTFTQSFAGRAFGRWPALQRAALEGLDLAYRIALLPFRRTRVDGRASESAAVLANTAAYNDAAERYFAGFTDPTFLLERPFSDAALAPKHLIDAGVLIGAMRLRARDVVAEVGAGSCWLSHMLNRYGCKTISIDVSPTALALGRQLFERDSRTKWTLDPKFLAYDGRRLPLGDGCCDRIVVNDAFHHIPNQREILIEMHRVLRADGLVAMSEPGYGHAAAAHSAAEAESGVLENELVLEDLAALAEQVGFREVTVIAASPLVRYEIPARDLGAFMGGKGFTSYWKALCSGLEQHHYIVLHKASPQPDTRRPARLTARIDTGQSADVVYVKANERLTLDLRVTNIGDTRWLAGQAAGDGWTRVGAHLYRAGLPRELLDFDWFRMDLPHDIRPGERVGLKATLPALDSPGDYLVVLDLVVEHLTWFADRGSSPATLLLRIT
jgi:SAM-dependent methyltransferase